MLAQSIAMVSAPPESIAPVGTPIIVFVHKLNIKVACGASNSLFWSCRPYVLPGVAAKPNPTDTVPTKHLMAADASHTLNII